jgi:hypothetical protein
MQAADEALPSSLATEGHFKEYEQALGTYRFTYQTIWAAGSIFISASAAVIAVALSGSGGADLRLLAAAPLPFVFWWAGVFTPMNRYGELHATRAAELEATLNARVPGLTMTHFTAFNEGRRAHTGMDRLKRIVCTREPRVSEVVNAAGASLLGLELALLVYLLINLIP